MLESYGIIFPKVSGRLREFVGRVLDSSTSGMTKHVDIVVKMKQVAGLPDETGGWFT